MSGKIIPDGKGLSTFTGNELAIHFLCAHRYIEKLTEKIKERKQRNALLKRAQLQKLADLEALLGYAKSEKHKLEEEIDKRDRESRPKRIIIKFSRTVVPFQPRY